MVKLKCKNEYFRIRGVFVKNKKSYFKILLIIFAFIIICNVAFVFSGCENQKTIDLSSTTSTSTTSTSTTSISTTSISTTSINSEDEIKPNENSSITSIGHSDIIPPEEREWLPPPDPIALAKRDCAGQTVHILMDRQYDAEEKKAIDYFEKQTNVNIETIFTTTKELGSKLSTDISSENKIDISIIYLDKLLNRSNAFDKTVYYGYIFLYDDYYVCAHSKTGNKARDFWDKDTSQYFLNKGVSSYKSWLCAQGNYVTYYNPKLLTGLADPYELYKQGKWNFSIAKEIATAVNKNGSNGMAMQSMDAYMLSSGLEFVSFKSGKYTNNLTNETYCKKVIDIFGELSDLYKDGILTKYSLEDFTSGKTAMITTTAYGLNKYSGWFDDMENKGELKAVPVAGTKGKTTYIPYEPIAFGIKKSAPNPKAAAYFLSYFLNYKNTKVDNTFDNAEFKEVFNILTNKSAKKMANITRSFTVVETNCFNLVITPKEQLNQKINPYLYGRRVAAANRKLN